MKKKKILLGVFISIIIIIFSIIYIYHKKITKPEKVDVKFKECLLVENDKDSNKKINIRIKGTIYKRVILNKKMEIFKVLDGYIYINDKKYKLDIGITRDHVYFGNAYLNENLESDFTVFLSENLNTLYLVNEKDKYEISSGKSIDDFKNIKNKFLK